MGEIRGPQKRFEAQHASYPDIYVQLVIAAKEAKAAGRHPYLGNLYETLNAVDSPVDLSHEFTSHRDNIVMGLLRANPSGLTRVEMVEMAGPQPGNFGRDFERQCLYHLEKAGWIQRNGTRERGGGRGEGNIVWQARQFKPKWPAANAGVYACYARLIMERESDLAGFFTVGRRTVDKPRVKSAAKIGQERDQILGVRPGVTAKAIIAAIAHRISNQKSFVAFSAGLSTEQDLVIQDFFELFSVSSHTPEDRYLKAKQKILIATDNNPEHSNYAHALDILYGSRYRNYYNDLLAKEPSYVC